MRDKLKQFHREMWLWLADNPSINERSWPGWSRPDVQEILNGNFPAGKYVDVRDCFACGAAALRVGSEEDVPSVCHHCPIHWGTDVNGNPGRCFFIGTAYFAWHFPVAGGTSRRKAALWLANAWDNPSEWGVDDEE